MVQKFQVLIILILEDHKDFQKEIKKNTAAIMVETIMGEGGIKVIPDKCLKDLRKFVIKKKYY